MKYNFFFCAMILTGFITPSYAQHSRIDSLKQQLNRQNEDTLKVNTLILLTDDLQQSDANTALSYANECMNLSKKLDYKKGMIKSYLEMGNANISLGNYPMSLEYYGKGMELAGVEKDSVDIGAFYDDIGIVKYHQGQIDSALYFRKKGMNIYKQLHLEKRQANAFVWIGNFYLSQAAYPDALENYLAASGIYEKIKDSVDLGFVLANLSSVYRQNKEYSKAVKAASDAVGIFRKTENKYGLGTSLYRLSLVYSVRDDWVTAVKYLIEAKKDFEEIRDKYFLSLVDNELGDNMRSQKEFEKALNYFNEALINCRETGDKSLYASILSNVGVLYADQGIYKNAIKYLDSSQVIFKELNARNDLRDSYEQSINVYARLNMPDSLAGIFSLYKQVSDSIFSEESNKNLADLQTKYETQKKTDSLSRQQQVITFQKKAITSRNYFLATLLLFIFIIGAFLIWTRRQSSKIAYQYNEIAQLQSELKHRTANFFTTISSMLSLAKSAGSEKDIINDISQRVNTINHLYNTLYNSSEGQQVSFRSLVTSICADFKNSYDKEKPVQLNVSIEAEVSREEAIPLAYIITELLTNSYKHAFNGKENGIVNIVFSESGGTRRLQFSDNGVGMPEDRMAHQSGKGIAIIKGYGKSLGGKTTIINQNGFHYTLEF